MAGARDRTGAPVTAEQAEAFAQEWVAGNRAMTLLHANHRGQRVAESVEFGGAGKVVRSMACHAP